MGSLVERIRKDWQSCPHIVQACLTLYEYLGVKEVDELSFWDIKKIAGQAESIADEDWAKLLQYLTGAGIGVLEVRCYLIYDGEEYILPNDDYLSALSTNLIAHPATGEEIGDARTHIFPWYIPGQIFSKSA